MHEYERLMLEAHASGIANYERKDSWYGPKIVITYNNGAKIEKPDCEACYYNAVDPAKYYANGCKSVPCTACLHRKRATK